MISLQPQQTSKNNKEILQTTSLQTARLVKNVPAMQETWFDSWVGKIPWRRDRLPTPVFLGFPCGSTGKESACNTGDLGSIPGLGRSPGEENSYPLQYSGLEDSMDCVVHGVAKSQTRLSDFYFHFILQMMKQQFQEVKQNAQSHPGYKRQK